MGQYNMSAMTEVFYQRWNYGNNITIVMCGSACANVMQYV